MKKNIFYFILFSFFTNSSLSAQVTVGEISPQNTTLNPCKEYDFSVDVSDFNEETETLMLDFNLPVGQSLYSTNYGQIINGTAIEITSTGGATSFVLSYEVAVGCVFNDTTINSGHSFDIVVNGVNNSSRIVSYTINSPSIAFQSGTNLAYTAAKAGVPVQRTFIYTNTSSSAFTGTIKFSDTTEFSSSATGVRFVGSASASSSNSSAITSIISMIVTNTSASIEVSVNNLAQNATVTFIDSVLLEKCPSGSVDNSLTRYHIVYGCESSNLCTKVGDNNSRTSTKFDPNDKPNIKAEHLSLGYNACAANDKERIVRIINTGQGNSTGLHFLFSYNPFSITTIDFPNMTLSWDISGTNTIPFTQESGIIESRSILATFQTDSITTIFSGDTLYLRYTEIVPCIDTAQYASMFNQDILAHWEMVHLTLLHPCFSSPSSGVIHPAPYGTRNWEHTFGVKQSLENLVAMMTDSLVESFAIQSSTPLNLGRGTEGFIYPMSSAALKIELELGSGVQLVNDSITMTSPDGSSTITLHPYSIVPSYGSLGAGSGDKITAYFSFPADFYETYPFAVNGWGFVDSPKNKFIKFFNDFRVNFDLKAICALSDGGKSKVEQKLFFVPDTTCLDCILPFSSVADEIQINCPGCLVPGWNMHVFNVNRVNLGLQDDNNNNYPDDTSSPYTLLADPSLAKLKRIMVGDTIVCDIHGHTSNGDTTGALFSNLNLDYGQFVLQGHLVNSLEFLGAEGIYYNNNDSTSFPFSIPIPVGVFHSNGFTIDMGITALNSYGVAISGFNENHFIEIRPKFRVKNNLINGSGGEPSFSVEDFNTIINMSGEPFNGIAPVGSNEDASSMNLAHYLSLTTEEKNSLFYWCTQGLARIVGIGAGFSSSQSAGNVSLELDPCYKMIIFDANTTVGGSAENQKVFNTFSYELRNLWMLDSITFNFPNELEYDGATFVLIQLTRDSTTNLTSLNGSPNHGGSYVDYDFGDELISGNSVTIYPSKHFDLITQSMSSGNFAGYDETKRYRIFFRLRMKDCQQFPDVIEVTNYPTMSHWSNFPRVGDTTITQIMSSNAYFHKPSAKFITQVLNDQQNTTDADLSWDINLEVDRQNFQPHGDGLIFARADSSFLYVVSPSGNISVNNLVNRNTNALINPSYSIDGFPLFKIGLIGANLGGFVDAKLKLNASFDCSELTGRDSLYIITGWNCYGYPAAIEDACYKYTTVVYIEPEIPGLQAELIIPSTSPTQVSTCDTIPYKIRVKATGVGEVKNISVKMTLPNGLDYASNSGVLTFETNSQQINPNISTPNYTWNLDSALFMAGFDGLDSEAYLNFNLISYCGFSSGEIKFEIIGENFCGKLIPQQAIILTSTVIVNRSELNLDSLSVSITATDMNACSDSTQVDITVTNLGNSATSSENTLEVTLPNGFTTANNSSTSFGLPIINAGNSHTETFFITNNEENTCGTKEIIANAIAVASYFCQTSQDACSTSLSIASDTTAFNVLFPSANFTLTSDTLCLNKEILFHSGEACAISHLWEFGDGATSTDASTSHTYTSEGSYTVKHTITSRCGSDTYDAIVYVKECCQIAPLTAGDCKKCDASMTVTYDPENPSCVYVESCKDLSNVVLEDCDGNKYKFDNLTGTSGYFCHPSGEAITTVWVKSGCFLSGDGPGYGRRFDHPCNPCEEITTASFSKSFSDNNSENSNLHLDSRIEIYPNPFTESITITAHEECFNSKVNFYNIFGQLIFSIDILKNTEVLNVSNLANGVYIVKIIQGESAEVRRFVKQK